MSGKRICRSYSVFICSHAVSAKLAVFHSTNENPNLFWVLHLKFRNCCSQLVCTLSIYARLPFKTNRSSVFQHSLTIHLVYFSSISLNNLLNALKSLLFFSWRYFAVVLMVTVCHQEGKKKKGYVCI